MKRIVFLLFLLGSFPFPTPGLQCYSCSDEKDHKCGDTFSSTATGVTRVNSTSGYCWKIKAEMGDHHGIIRGGDLISNQHPQLACPTMNTCLTGDNRGAKGTICCCQDKDFCNTAGPIPAALRVLLLCMFASVFA
ncbi:unnamed protein product [Adineta ricciae]|uniref:Protein quiver n=1 Tax=Adineta ricciae TaxID=249248 RepID=A0A815S2J4_ADIRI|nr:unnamed protein product [Adineta ricciae]CAF1484566.1 unnamed protein product [Adineta ricciae]